jgi:hypothetical protein
MGVSRVEKGVILHQRAGAREWDERRVRRHGSGARRKDVDTPSACRDEMRDFDNPATISPAAG